MKHRCIKWVLFGSVSASSASLCNVSLLLSQRLVVALVVLLALQPRRFYGRPLNCIFVAHRHCDVAFAGSVHWLILEAWPAHLTREAAPPPSGAGAFVWSAACGRDSNISSFVFCQIETRRLISKARGFSPVFGLRVSNGCNHFAAPAPIMVAPATRVFEPSGVSNGFGPPDLRS